jgi:hypothetical protein
MAIYNWKCPHCNETAETRQSISEYTKSPNVPGCEEHGPMERMLVLPDGWNHALTNALAGDRHYDGMVAPDGTDISSRTKHREYMKRNGLTTADDYKETWRKEGQLRELSRMGQLTERDKNLRQTIERELYRRIR